MSRKRFIDKNKSVSFHLLHRSQRDPLAADESAPAEGSRGWSKIPKAMRGLSRRELNAKYGIYFDDDYNYLQHMKDAKKQDVVWVESVAAAKKGASAPTHLLRMSCRRAGPSLQLPSSLFASNVEEKVGLLNKAAPDHSPPDEIESELNEIMDDGYAHDPQNELEDNFFELAGGLATDSESDDEIEVEWMMRMGILILISSTKKPSTI
ncbi:protein LTV1 homolog [Pollicipes pollicipes]|uniref:protein LTV1 homolog n=1 Tax=Pollicipes pollicipes TaxID=41117 RepID=UPI00188501EE|nr:protein LTV1 homolog [Pollicipes pollicipes]